MSEGFINPLGQLCRQMGVSIPRLAHMTGCSESAVRESLSDEPSAALRAFVGVTVAIEARVRITKAPPLIIWLDLAYLDKMYFGVDYRRYRQLPELPANRGALRGWIQKMRKSGKTYGEICDTLDKGHICTSDGFALWRRSTINQHMGQGKIKLPRDDKALIPQQETVDRWRQYVLSHLLATVCPEDPMFAARYGMRPRYDLELCRVWLETTKPLPTGPRAWFLRGMNAASFWEGKWGQAEAEEHPLPQTAVEPAPLNAPDPAPPVLA